MAMKRLLWASLLLLGLLLAACGPEPTPFPVGLPATPTVEPIATETPEVRLLMAANTIDYVEELDLLQEQMQVEQTLDVIDPVNLGQSFDLVATYGAYEGWQQSPVRVQVMLVINPLAAPMSPQMADILRRAVQPQSFVEALGLPGMSPAAVITADAGALRQEMANLGQPDGLRIALGHSFVPGVIPLTERLAEINMRTRIVALPREQLRAEMQAGRIHAALVTWSTPEEQQAWRDLFGAAFALDLYNLPISYLALPQLSVQFTPGGWPSGTWQ